MAKSMSDHLNGLRSSKKPRCWYYTKVSFVIDIIIIFSSFFISCVNCTDFVSKQSGVHNFMTKLFGQIPLPFPCWK